MTVIDVTDQDFDTEVLQRSHDVPVVVDFWAGWCQPCLRLAPILDKAAEKREGKVVLAKLDTDANPAVSERFGIQSLPTVKAFVNGEIAAEFLGAQPPSQVEAFMDGLVPSETQLLLDAGDEASLLRAVELEPANVDANFSLARLRYENGDAAGALEHLHNVTGNFCADGLAARIELEEEGGSEELQEAFEALDDNDVEDGLNKLLALLEGTDDETERERIRKVIVAILDELGVEHPLARESRRRLAAALY